MKVKELGEGNVLWKGNSIIGITKATVPDKYLDMECKKVYGNEFDYEIIKKERKKK